MRERWPFSIGIKAREEMGQEGLNMKPARGLSHDGKGTWLLEGAAARLREVRALRNCLLPGVIYLT